MRPPAPRMLVASLILFALLVPTTRPSSGQAPTPPAGDVAAAPTARLPAKWHGTWRGTLRSTAGGRTASSVPVVFEVGPVAGGDDLRWVMTFGAGAHPMAKDYRLVPDRAAPGRFAIDEQNGVVLPARLVGDVMHCVFQTGDLVLAARYEHRGDAIVFEVVSTSVVAVGPVDATDGAAGGAAGAETNATVRGRIIDGVQSVTLARVADAPRALLPPTPDDWRYERIELPPAFAPDLDLDGYEELRFAPGMFDPDSASYFSYVFGLRLERATEVDAAFVRSFMERYYRGLCEAVAEGRNLDLDLSGFAVDVARRGNAFVVTVDMVDPFVTAEPLRLTIELWSRAAGGGTDIFAIASPLPADTAIWRAMRSMADGW